MKATIKKTFSGLIFFFNLCCIILLIASNLAPLAAPGKYWPIAFLGILFPLLLAATIIFMFFWIFVQRRKSLISLLAILISIPNIVSTFAFHLPQKFPPVKQPGNIRVVTWNVGLMNYTTGDSMTAVTNNLAIFKQLREADADIICLQEFFSPVLPGILYNLMDSIALTMGYPFHYFSMDIPKFDRKIYTGSIIFSRHKIIDTIKIIYPPPFPGSIIKAGIVLNNDTIDIFTTRLQSVGFQRDEYRELNDIKNGTDSAFEGSKNIIRKLKYGYTQRVEQVAIVKKLIANSNRPVIFTGDLNDVPVSYTYSTVKNSMSDAWIEKGAGLGRTFRFIFPTLRIDHIFYNNYLKAKHVTRMVAGEVSDHHGIIADLVLIKKEL